MHAVCDASGSVEYAPRSKREERNNGRLCCFASASWNECTNCEGVLKEENSNASRSKTKDLFKKIPWDTDFMELGDEERRNLLSNHQFTEEEMQNIDTTLQALPSIEMTANVFVEHEEEIQVGDVVTCRVRNRI